MRMQSLKYLPHTRLKVTVGGKTLRRKMLVTVSPPPRKS